MCSVCIIIKHVHANVAKIMSVSVCVCVCVEDPANFASIISYWIWTVSVISIEPRSHIIPTTHHHIFFIYEFIARNNAY